MTPLKPTLLVVSLLVLASICSGRQPVARPTASQRAAQSEGWLDRRMQGIRRYLQQAVSGAPTPFPQPTVAAALPYTDNQQMVLNTSASPFSAIGQLLLTDSEGGLGYCSGSLIAPNVVLTAAHCWFEDTAARNGTFSPGYSAAVQPRRPFGYANIVSVKLPTAFTTCRDSQNYQSCQGLNDFAVFFLDKSFTHTLSYGYSSSLPATETAYTAGYPADKCNADSTTYFGQCPMWYTACPGVTYNDNSNFETETCLSGQGQSGSPVWVTPTSGQAVQTAILTSTPDNDVTISYDGETTTLNVVITPQRYTTIQTWVKSGPSGKDANTTLYPASPHT